MLRALAIAALALIVCVLAATPAQAETVTVGPCEVDGCTKVCVDVRQPCQGGRLACQYLPFHGWTCTPV